MVLQQHGWSQQTCYIFLRETFIFYFILGLFCTQTGGWILMIYMSYNVFPRKDVPFGACIDTAPHLGGQISQNPHFGA